MAISVGTNDSAPWKAVPLDRAVAALAAALAPHRVDRWVLVTSPGVDESRLGRAADRKNATLAAYAVALGEVVTAAGGSVLDAAALLAPLGPRAFVEDGVHLSGAGYDVLLPALADAVSLPTG